MKQYLSHEVIILKKEYEIIWFKIQAKATLPKLLQDEIAKSVQADWITKGYSLHVQDYYHNEFCLHRIGMHYDEPE